VLAHDRVRVPGEPVVAIAAETPAAAAAAADLVRVDYEPLPGIYDPLAALAAARRAPGPALLVLPIAFDPAERIPPYSERPGEIRARFHL
ncbi:MAG TPA: hypothetical protein VK878_10225, partial [Candidatus Deferrimicrobiaceae bacterium]|nr:hypothetical protein [Candidatus Deferrimicrobiaceae bacterium]